MASIRALITASLLFSNVLQVQGQDAKGLALEIDSQLYVDDEDWAQSRSSPDVAGATFEYFGSGDLTEKFLVDPHDVSYYQSEYNPYVISGSILDRATDERAALSLVKWDLPTVPKEHHQTGKHEKSKRPDFWWTGNDDDELAKEQKDAAKDEGYSSPDNNQTMIWTDGAPGGDNLEPTKQQQFFTTSSHTPPPSRQTIARALQRPKLKTKQSAEPGSEKASTERPETDGKTVAVESIPHSLATTKETKSTAAHEDEYQRTTSRTILPIKSEVVTHRLTSAETSVPSDTQTVPARTTTGGELTDALPADSHDNGDFYFEIEVTDPDSSVLIANASLGVEGLPTEFDLMQSKLAPIARPTGDNIPKSVQEIAGNAEKKLGSDGKNFQDVNVMINNGSDETIAIAANVSQDLTNKTNEIGSKSPLNETVFGKSLHEHSRSRSASKNRCLFSRNFCPVGESCHWNGGYATCRKSIQIDFCRVQRCFNGGECYSENESFRCDCLDGFSGRHCEIELESPCRPNPCKGDCDCRKSCRHELGYECLSKGGFTGKNCTIPIPTLFCEPNQIRLDVSPLLLLDFNQRYDNPVVYASPTPTSTIQQSPGCRATNVRSNLQIVVPFPFHKCGTVSHQHADGTARQIFRNRLWADKQGPGFSMPIPIVDFECTYESQYSIVTSLKPVLSIPLVVTKSGRHPVELQLCKISPCPQICPTQYRVNYGAIYIVGELIHLTVYSSSTLASSLGLLMSVENLAFSCDRAQATSPLGLIHKGCPAASGMHVLSSTGRTACVSFQTPRAKFCTTVYLHVRVRFCAGHEMEVCSTGARKCKSGSSRTKRSLHSPVSSSVIGPFDIIEGAFGRGNLDPFPKYEPRRLNRISKTLNPDPNIEERRKESATEENGVVSAAVAVCATLCFVIAVLIVGWCGVLRMSKEQKLVINAT